MRFFQIAAFVAVMAATCVRQAEAMVVPLDWCAPLALTARAFAEIRDMGADRDKHLAVVVARARAAESSPLVVRSLQQLLRRVYAARHITPEALEQLTLRHCIENVGDLGEES